MVAEVILNIGFAGSGKSLFTSSFTQFLETNKKKVYIVNLDPAVVYLDYEPNLDIRDTVNFKNVMKSYNLGPNGAIVTCINMFVTKIDQIIDLIDSKKDIYDYIVIDTPGQIELFTWSVAGEIISISLASKFSCKVFFIVDSSKCQNVKLFIGNILHICSVYYKLGLPLEIIFNKSDNCNKEKLLNYMKLDDSFTKIIEKQIPNYSSELLTSMSETFEEIFKSFPFYFASSISFNGMQDIYDGL